jgi:putative ABC transport system ATP-binding protein
MDASTMAEGNLPVDPIAIDLADLEFAWRPGPPILRLPRLTVGLGERIFLQGPSGSGKSTLLALVAGILRPQHGTVQVLDQRLEGLAASSRDRFRGQHIGFIFQLFNLLPYLSVRDNVLLPLRFSQVRRRRLDGVSPDSECRRLLGALGLEPRRFLGRSVLALSIGEQQRVAAARALIGRPEIVIADEPTSSLDADVRREFLDLLMNECKAFGTTLLFVSHDTGLGSQFDRVLSMRDLNRVSGPSS